MTTGLRTGLVAGGTAVLVSLGGYAAVTSGALPMPAAATAEPGAGGPHRDERGHAGTSRTAGSADYTFSVQVAAHHESAVEMGRLAHPSGTRGPGPGRAPGGSGVGGGEDRLQKALASIAQSSSLIDPNTRRHQRTWQPLPDRGQLIAASRF